MAASIGVIQNAKIKIVGLDDVKIVKGAARQYVDEQIYFRAGRATRVEDKVIEIELEPRYYP